MKTPKKYKKHKFASGITAWLYPGDQPYDVVNFYPKSFPVTQVVLHYPVWMLWTPMNWSIFEEVLNSREPCGLPMHGISNFEVLGKLRGCSTVVSWN